MRIPESVFPFGEPLRIVRQEDRSPKRIFVLGVYASAVHARWVNPLGKVFVKALAVASEPCIFWNGEDAAAIISKIKVPEPAGRLESADLSFNGPSGRALDEDVLKPLGLTRSDAWLSDLVPHSCFNSGQQKAVRTKYTPMAKKFGLPISTIEPVPKVLADDGRRRDILDELLEAGSDLLITLGDQPLKWFTSPLAKTQNRLTEFGKSDDTYGRLHSIEIDGHRFQLLPIAHPRQMRRLGPSDSEWARIYRHWAEHVAPTLL